MPFRTFQQARKSKITFGKILITLVILDILAIIALLILAFLPQYYRMKDDFLYQTFTLNLVLVALLIISAIYYIGFRGKKKEKVSGLLELKENEIVLNGTSIPLADIQKVRIIGNDIKGEFRGFVSKGSQNQIIITKITSEELSSFFEQTIENPLRNSKNILDLYHDKGILSESNFTNIMNNTNYF